MVRGERLCLNFLKSTLEPDMSNEQAAPDYTAIAKTLRFQNKAFINGTFCNALSGEVV